MVLRAGTWVGEDQFGTWSNGSSMSPVDFFNAYFGGGSPWATWRFTLGLNPVPTDKPPAKMAIQAAWINQVLTLCDSYPNIQSHFLAFMSSSDTNDPFFNNLMNNTQQWQNLATLAQACAGHKNVWIQLENEYIYEWTNGTYAQKQAIVDKFMQTVQSNGALVESDGSDDTLWHATTYQPIPPHLLYRQYPYKFTPPVPYIPDTAAASLAIDTGPLDKYIEFGEYTNVNPFPATIQPPADPTVSANVNGWNQAVIDQAISQLILVPTREAAIPTAGYTDSGSTTTFALWNNTQFKTWWLQNANFQRYFVLSGVGGVVQPPTVATVTLMASSPAANTLSVSGSVLDASNNGISGIAVTIADNGGAFNLPAGQTDASGNYSASWNNITAGTYNVRANASNVLSLQQSVTISGTPPPPPPPPQPKPVSGNLTAKVLVASGVAVVGIAGLWYLSDHNIFGGKGGKRFL